MTALADNAYTKLAQALIPEGKDLSRPHFTFEQKEGGHRFTFCVPKRPGVAKYLSDMLSQWLVPGCSFPISHLFFTEEESVTVGELFLETGGRTVHFARLEHELVIGALSAYHARRILELKAVSPREKMSRVQELLTDAICRFPDHFDHDLFASFHRLLLATPEEFRRGRSVRYLARLVSASYLIQKALRAAVDSAPGERHLRVKLMQTRVHDLLGVRHTLGIVVGLNFLRENEVFAKKHLLRAIQDEFPDIVALHDTAFSEGPLQFLYLEVEKGEGKSFTAAEIAQLRAELPGNLRGRIEHLHRPLFMPRNEEEVMRCIVTLTGQLKYKRDLPQVIVKFDEQKGPELIFTLIFARVLHDKSIPIAKLLGEIGQIEKVRKMGRIRRRFAKEVAVLRLSLPIHAFIRDDETVDIAKARAHVLSALHAEVGEFRDYNGGMLSKQAEALTTLRTLLGPIAAENSLLLENFFHALFPVEFRAVAPPEALCALFHLLVRALERGDTALIEERDDALFLLVSGGRKKEALLAATSREYTLSLDLLMLQYQGYDRVFLGYIFFESDPEKRADFRALYEKAITC